MIEGSWSSTELFGSLMGNFGSGCISCIARMAVENWKWRTVNGNLGKVLEHRDGAGQQTTSMIRRIFEYGVVECSWLIA